MGVYSFPHTALAAFFFLLACSDKEARREPYLHAEDTPIWFWRGLKDCLDVVQVALHKVDVITLRGQLLGRWRVARPGEGVYSKVAAARRSEQSLHNGAALLARRASHEDGARHFYYGYDGFVRVYGLWLP